MTKARLKKALTDRTAPSWAVAKEKDRRPMSLILDLSKVPSGDRAAVWRNTIRDNYLDLDIRLKSAAQPSGLIAQSHAGSVTFAALSSVPQAHERTTSLMEDDVDHLLGWMQFRGRAHLEQHERVNDIDPGAFVILDCAKPYRAEFRDEYQIFVIKIPRIFFKSAILSNKDLINVCKGASKGGNCIVDYFRTYASNFNFLSLEQRAAMGAFGVRLMVETVTAET